MRKNELARAVARARRRPAGISAAARDCREQLAGVALATSERLAALPALLRRLGAASRTDRWTVAVLVAALGRLRWTERIALPFAALVLAGGAGAYMPVLIAGETPEGVAAAFHVAAPIPGAQASPELVRFVAPSQRSARPADGGARPTGTRSAAVVAVQEGSTSAVDQPARAQVRSSQGGTPEPSAGLTDQASAAPKPDVQEPTPDPTPGPTPAPPIDEEPQEEPAEAKATLCHKAGSKSAKTIEVGEDAVEEHLAHGDTLGVCP